MSTPDKEKWLQIYYQETGYFIRQFNLVRTSIAGFLITIGASRIEKGIVTEDLWSDIGFICLISALVISIYFSSLIRQRSEFQKDIKRKIDSSGDEEIDYSKFKFNKYTENLWSGFVDVINIICAFFVVAIVGSSISTSSDINDSKNNILTQQILFSHNQANLSQSALQVLDKIRSFNEDYPDSIYLLSSHTDSTGTEKTNIQLAKQRTLIVRNALQKQIGIQANRIFSVNLNSEFQPVISHHVSKEPLNRVTIIIAISQAGI